MIKYTTRRNYVPGKGETQTMVSQTIPDQALSLETLLERYTRGQSIATIKQPYYEQEDDDFPDTTKMSKLERIDAARAAAAETEALRAKLRKDASAQAEEKKAAAEDAKIKAKVTEALDKEKNQPPPP